MKWAATLAVAAATVCLVSVQAVCPNGFVNLADEGETEACFLFLQISAKWHTMRVNCEVLGHDLAKLTGNLHQKVMQYIDDHSATGLKGASYWVGGTDEVTEGSWKWVVDNSNIPLGTPHWYQCNKKDEPSGGTDKNYMCLLSKDYFFHSCDGNLEMYGICQEVKKKTVSS